jgi:hypothetical protein
MRELSALEKSILHYERFRRKFKELELNWFRNQPSLEAAITQAALAIDRHGKRQSHQRRIKRAALESGRDKLLLAIDQIRECETFDDLHGLIEAIVYPISGLGELYIYDSTVRIGAKLGLQPNKVYVHAGTRIGAHQLGLNTKARTLDIGALPEPLRRLPADDIEDILCIYKDKLSQVPI